jgi:hypothetical protein
MFGKIDAAHYCGRPVKRFEAECPVAPVRFSNGDLRWDMRDLDSWIDLLKLGGGGSSDAILEKLG